MKNLKKYASIFLMLFAFSSTFAQLNLNIVPPTSPLGNSKIPYVLPTGKWGATTPDRIWSDLYQGRVTNMLVPFYQKTQVDAALGLKCDTTAYAKIGGHNFQGNYGSYGLGLNSETPLSFPLVWGWNTKETAINPLYPHSFVRAENGKLVADYQVGRGDDSHGNGTATFEDGNIETKWISTGVAGQAKGSAKVTVAPQGAAQNSGEFSGGINFNQTYQDGSENNVGFETHHAGFDAITYTDSQNDGNVITTGDGELYVKKGGFYVKQGAGFIEKDAATTYTRRAAKDGNGNYSFQEKITGDGVVTQTPNSSLHLKNGGISVWSDTSMVVSLFSSNSISLMPADSSLNTLNTFSFDNIPSSFNDQKNKYVRPVVFVGKYSIDGDLLDIEKQKLAFQTDLEGFDNRLGITSEIVYSTDINTRKTTHFTFLDLAKRVNLGLQNDIRTWIVHTGQGSFTVENNVFIKKDGLNCLVIEGEYPIIDEDGQQIGLSIYAAKIGSGLTYSQIQIGQSSGYSSTNVDFYIEGFEKCGIGVKNGINLPIRHDLFQANQGFIGSKCSFYKETQKDGLDFGGLKNNKYKLLRIPYKVQRIINTGSTVKTPKIYDEPTITADIFRVKIGGGYERVPSIGPGKRVELEWVYITGVPDGNNSPISTPNGIFLVTDEN